MKTTYLLIAFIAATALFFYFAGNLNRTANFVLPENVSDIQSNAGSAGNKTGVKNPSAPDFQGPIIKPGTGFIGPSGPPPNY